MLCGFERGSLEGDGAAVSDTTSNKRQYNSHREMPIDRVKHEMLAATTRLNSQDLASKEQGTSGVRSNIKYL